VCVPVQVRASVGWHGTQACVACMGLSNVCSVCCLHTCCSVVEVRQLPRHKPNENSKRPRWWDATAEVGWGLSELKASVCAPGMELVCLLCA